MQSPTKKRSVRKRNTARTPVRRNSTVDAGATIRRIGHQWARHWNAGELDAVVAAYTVDAVYLPPHHQAIHGREAIREYLKGPLRHGVSNLAFEVTYVRQQGQVAWDVGTYRMTVPVNEETRKEDHGKYLTVWKRTRGKWLITADAWSSDLPA